jgi:hypothetical protein
LYGVMFVIKKAPVRFGPRCAGEDASDADNGDRYMLVGM